MITGEYKIISNHLYMTKNLRKEKWKKTKNIRSITNQISKEIIIRQYQTAYKYINNLRKIEQIYKQYQTSYKWNNIKKRKQIYK